MRLKLVKDNGITIYGVPENYIHDDGRITLGYNLLPLEVLQEHGWVEDDSEVVENKRVITEEEKYRDMVDQLFSAYLSLFTVEVV